MIAPLGSSSFTPPADPRLRMPDTCVVDYLPGVFFEGDLDLGQVTDGEEDVDSSDESDSPLRRVARPVNYMRLLEDAADGHHVLGTLYAVLGLLGDLWDEGMRDLVGSLALALQACPAGDHNRAQLMSLEALRRCTRRYLPETPMPLPPFWPLWVQRAIQGVLCDSATVLVDEGTPVEENEPEVLGLMQTTGGRLTLAERLSRPHRPREWIHALGRDLDGTWPEVSERVRALLRQWLVSRVNRIGGVFAVMGMMIRDVADACSLTDGSQVPDVEALRLAGEIQQRMEAWLERNHRSELFARQPALLQQAIFLAVQIDELDFDQIPVLDDELRRMEHEEVQVMYNINNLVRRVLPREEEERSRRIRLLEEAVRNQLGSESRHLRRLGVALHGLQMLGSSSATVDARVTDDQWLPATVDEILLFSGREEQGLSEEREWSEEVLSLRRWLAEDHLRAGPGPSGQAEETGSSGPSEGDVSHLMQRGKGDRGRQQRDRSRSHRAASPRRRRRHRAQRLDARTNAHRPWRTRTTTSFMSAGPSSGMATTAPSRPTLASTPATARPGSRDPAEIRMPNGTCRSAGVHAWHVLLHMADAFTAPADLQYGLHPHQRANVRASLEGMELDERIHMLSSFLRMVALLVGGVADAVDHVMHAEGRGDEDYVNVEADEEALMQCYLVQKKGHGTASSSSGVRTMSTEGVVAEGGLLETLLGDPFEMELRSMVSALELTTAKQARVRARGLRERLVLRYAGTLPDGMELMDSALATFVDESTEAAADEMDAQDRDFIDYWWRHLTRRGRQQDQEKVAIRKPGTVADSEDLDVAAEERRLMEAFEMGDAQRRQAASEYAAVVDSQEAEDEYRASLSEGQEASQTSMQVALQGWVPQGDAPQTLRWTMWPGQSLRLQLDGAVCKPWQAEGA